MNTQNFDPQTKKEIVQTHLSIDMDAINGMLSDIEASNLSLTSVGSELAWMWTQLQRTSPSFLNSELKECQKQIQKIIDIPSNNIKFITSWLEKVDPERWISDFQRLKNSTDNAISDEDHDALNHDSQFLWNKLDQMECTYAFFRVCMRNSIYQEPSNPRFPKINMKPTRNRKISQLVSQSTRIAEIEEALEKCRNLIRNHFASCNICIPCLCGPCLCRPCLCGP